MLALLLACSEPNPDRDAERPDEDGIPNATDIVASARSLTGSLTDPTMGRWDLLRRMGMRVCTDVANDAYFGAGIPLARLVHDAALATPERFPLTPDNLPDNPYFTRRVRNLRALFRLDPVPRPGDLAFFGNRHVAVVTSTANGYRVVEARGAQISEVPGAAVERALGVPAQFGGF